MIIFVGDSRWRQILENDGDCWFRSHNKHNTNQKNHWIVSILIKYHLLFSKANAIKKCHILAVRLIEVAVNNLIKKLLMISGMHFPIASLQSLPSMQTPLHLLSHFVLHLPRQMEKMQLYFETTTMDIMQLRLPAPMSHLPNFVQPLRIRKLIFWPKGMMHFTIICKNQFILVSFDVLFFFVS